MKKLTRYFFYFLLRVLLPLRYKIKVEGLEIVQNASLPKPGGILFLANHPAEVDPCILLGILWNKYAPHPVAIDYLFQNAFTRYFLDIVEGLSVPQFDHGTNSYKKWRMEKTYEKMYAYLRNKENILLYPSGGLKKQGEEVVGGASGVQTILQNCPEANVVLVRSKGLWGSSFSRALTGSSPNLIKVGVARFKDLLKNFLFFSPKREITVTFELPQDFPFQGTRLEINRYLEKWYNQEGPEPLNLVPYYFWKKEIPKAFEETQSLETFDLSLLPQDIVHHVKDELASLSGYSIAEIKEEMLLAKDLGLDSLDMAQLILFLKENYGINNIQVTELIKVEDVEAFAGKLKKAKGGGNDIEDKIVKGWQENDDRPPTMPTDCKTIQEAFLQTCDRMKKMTAASDLFLGEVSYKKLKISALLIAQELKKLPFDKIGIMMPSSITVNILILATLLANKIPVMINWTLGKRNLQAIMQETHLEKVISSWSFLDRLENVDLDGLDDKILLIEEMVRSFSKVAFIKALFWSYKKASTLMRKFGLTSISQDDHAVILFTSGTESLPKGVPLSHRNLLSNQKAAYERVLITEKDVLLGVLPPFHSFGFSITGLFPLLTGLRVVYYPNPTDGKKMASLIEKWKVTLLCIVPTFLKNLVRVASSEQLSSLRFVVTGAEKTPDELYEKMGKLNPHAVLGEGYGITECAPILTLNPYGQKRIGVGLPLKDVDILIVHPETHIPLPRNKEGLILAWGPNIFSGYLNPKIASPFMEIGGKKWYVTGDLGFLNEEGYLILSGRLKRFVKVGGEMISLASIEETLLAEAYVKGWSNDDKPFLAVSAKEEEGKKGEIHLFTTFDITLEEANDILKKRGMSNLIRIFQVHKVPFIPLLGTGKIDYKALSCKI